MNKMPANGNAKATDGPKRRFSSILSDAAQLSPADVHLKRRILRGEMFAMLGEATYCAYGIFR